MARVYDRDDSGDSDDASDMEVLGISVLVRLRTSRIHPAHRPQRTSTSTTKIRPPTVLAIEVSNGGETHYRI